MEVKTEYRNYSLSRKELEILRRIASGQTSQQIADAMCLSLPTIKWYRKQLRTKFGADSTAHLVRLALESKLI
ncbi:MAG: helix-turn-helix transcriptional regulator [Bacteroidales bacterium]|nr:helix-turn-helix transcriptional regulator [Bacteroidales bacterium]